MPGWVLAYRETIKQIMENFSVYIIKEQNIDWEQITTFEKKI